MAAAPKILIAEDNERLLVLASRALERGGFVVDATTALLVGFGGAGGHDVDARDEAGFLANGSFGRTHERLDAGAAERFFDVDASHGPQPARADDDQDQLLYRAHAGLARDRGFDAFLDRSWRLTTHEEIGVTPAQLERHVAER